MTMRERILYHQIHPLKLFTDISTAIIAIDLLWQHQLGTALVIGFVPPILVSFAIIEEVDLEPYRRSRMGAYLRRYMTPTAQALRLFGALFAFYASWQHVPAGILAAFALVAACWLNGIVPRRSPSGAGPPGERFRREMERGGRWRKWS
jgi:hypothetical protein